MEEINEIDKNKLTEKNNKEDSKTNDNSQKEGSEINNNNICNNVNNNQEQPQYKYEDYYKINQNNEKLKKRSKCKCSCSKRTKYLLRIIFCPCFCFIQAFACFWDNRCEIEPYYRSFLFLDNIIFFFISVIDLVFVIIFKGEVSTGFFIVRIISDSLGMLVFLLSLTLWSEEATEEDHMDPAFCSFTMIQGCLTTLLNISSLILFFKTDCEFKIILLIFQIIHLAIPIFLPLGKICCCQ